MGVYYNFLIFIDAGGLNRYFARAFFTLLKYEFEEVWTISAPLIASMRQSKRYTDPKADI